MRLPRKGEDGFTLIELLIVVTILGVLAAVVIPSVGRFIGRGEQEAAETELVSIQSAVVAMMVDNAIATLPNPVLEADATNDMSAFPDNSNCGDDKLKDPDGSDYTPILDKNGYILFEHDIIADGAQVDLVNYVATRFTKGTYCVDSSGTVTQVTTGYE